MSSLEILTPEVLCSNQNIRRVRSRIAWIVGKKEQDLPDLVNYTFQRAIQGLPKFRKEADPYTWLDRIATNVAFDWFNKRAIAASRIGVSLDDNDADERVFDLEAGSQSDPYQLLVVQRIEERIAAVLQRRRGRYAAIFEMRVRQGMRFPEIAAQINSSEASVRKMYYVVREYVRVGLQEAGMVQ